MNNMPIAQASASPVMTPLKALWRWLMAEPGQAQIDTDGALVIPARSCANTLCSQSLKAPQGLGIQPGIRSRPLRVLQVTEPGQPSAQAGRIRISGRMADVCAELDRLAACEAMLQ